MAQSNDVEGNAHEVEFVASFILKGKQERTLTLLSSKRRSKFTRELAHFDGFEPRTATPLNSKNAGTADALTSLLRDLGSPDSVWLISEQDSLDRRMMPLDAAIKSVWGGSFGTVISCIPGKLAFFRGEEKHSELLLRN